MSIRNSIFIIPRFFLPHFEVNGITSEYFHKRLLKTKRNNLFRDRVCKTTSVTTTYNFKWNLSFPFDKPTSLS